MGMLIPLSKEEFVMTHYDEDLVTVEMSKCERRLLQTH